MKREGNGTHGFMSGVLVLSVSTFIVKGLGLAYKIPMMNILGAEGMGYFNSAYEIFALLCVIATAGLPVALSMMVSARVARRDLGAVRRVYNTALCVFLTIGVMGTFAMLFFGESIALYIENEGAYASILAVAPALLFVSLSSSVRGYFQGFGRMLPTAVSQLIEALCKLILGVAFALYVLKNGGSVVLASAYAAVGLSVGTLLSAIFLLSLKLIDSRKLKREEILQGREKGIPKQLIKLAFPITVASAVLGVGKLVDMTLIMKRLSDIGYSSAGANGIYGAYTAMAVPVFSLIPSLLTPIALSLVPRLCGAAESGDRLTQREVVNSAMRLTTFLAIPASVGVAVYSKQILGLLFFEQYEAIEISFPLLSVLGVSILFSSLITTTNSILQSYSQTAKPIVSMLFGIAVKAVSAYILIGNELVGALGAPISTLLCDITVTGFNLYFIKRYSLKTEGVAKLFIRPLAASISMLCVSLAVYLPMTYNGVSESMAFIVAMVVAVMSYMFFAFVFGAVLKEDLHSLPFGKRVLEIFERFTSKRKIMKS